MSSPETFQGQNLSLQDVSDMGSFGKLDPALAADILEALLSAKDTRSHAEAIINRLAPVSQTIADLKEFLVQNPNPAAWFCQQFPYLDPSKVVAYVRPLGIAFYVEGYAYGQFVLKEGIRPTPNLPVSYGVTLNMDKLPLKYHHMFIVINEGDGNTGGRSDHQKLVTRLHEELHQFFELGFCKSHFISSSELSSRLNSITPAELSKHQLLAVQLARGMLEVSRSEIVSYFGTGEFAVTKRHLCGNFWLSHFQAVRNYLRRENATSEQKTAVLRCYHEGFIVYRDALNQVKANAKKACDNSHSISNPVLLGALLNFAPEIHTLPKPMPKSAIKELPEAA